MQSTISSVHSSTRRSKRSSKPLPKLESRPHFSPLPSKTQLKGFDAEELSSRMELTPDIGRSSEKMSEISTIDFCASTQDYEDSLHSIPSPVGFAKEGLMSERELLADENLRLEKEVAALRDGMERADEKYKSAVFLKSRADFCRKKAEKSLAEKERVVQDLMGKIKTVTREKTKLDTISSQLTELAKAVARAEKEIVQMYSRSHNTSRNRKATKETNRAKLAVPEEEIGLESAVLANENETKRAEVAQTRETLRGLEKKAKKLRCPAKECCGQKKELEEVLREKSGYKALYESHNTTSKCCQWATYVMVRGMNLTGNRLPSSSSWWFA